MARNPMKLPGLPKVRDDKFLKSEYTDKNLMAEVPLRVSSSLPSDKKERFKKLMSKFKY